MWLGLYFPRLALDYRCAMLSEPPSPLAMTQSHGGVERLHQVSDAAAACGIRCGMSRSAALATLPALELWDWDAAQEIQALNELAHWAFQFSSQVKLCPPQGLVLEVGKSVSLFGGLPALMRRIVAQLQSLRYDASLCLAPYAFSSWVLARAGVQKHLRDQAALMACLATLPVEALPLDEGARQALHQVGLTEIGQLLALPRDALQRRFDRTLPECLDRLQGQLDVPWPAFYPEERFRLSVLLPSPAHQVEALTFVLQRQVQALSGFLRQRAAGVRELSLTLAYDRAALEAEHFDWCLMQPVSEAGKLLRILRETLERAHLKDAVAEVALQAEHLDILPPGQTAFFQTRASQAETQWPYLVDRFRARLGREAVSVLALCADHRPEKAWVLCAPEQLTYHSVVPPDNPRPAWLLPEPRLLGAGLPSTWTLWRGPERIESGWWDGADVTRDYFIALNAQGQPCWVFRDRKPAGQWYLHGYFG